MTSGRERRFLTTGLRDPGHGSHHWPRNVSLGLRMRRIPVRQQLGGLPIHARWHWLYGLYRLLPPPWPFTYTPEQAAASYQRVDENPYNPYIDRQTSMGASTRIEEPIDSAASQLCVSIQERLQHGGLKKELASAMWDHFANMYRYSDYLGLLIEDWRAVSAECADRHNSFFAAARSSMTDAEYAEFTQIRLLALRLALVTESFIVFAKVFLDRVADAILWFFAEVQPRAGSSHTSLFGRGKRFERISATHSVILPETVSRLGEQLHARIIDARNLRVEHTAGVGSWGGPMILGEKALAVHYSRHAAQLQSSGVYDLETLAQELRSYVEEVLAFLDRNLEAINRIQATR